MRLFGSREIRFHLKFSFSVEMRLQKLPIVWRYIGFIAFVVYFFSFGTFMSRMMTLNQSSVERKHVTVPSHESTRLFANTPATAEPRSTLQLVQFKTARHAVHDASVQKQIQVPKSDQQSAVEVPLYLNLSIPYLSGLTKAENPQNKTMKMPTNSTPETAKSKQEEFKMNVMQMFQLLKNASIVKHDLSPEAQVNHLHNNWTEVGGINASGDHVVNPHPFKYLINTETPCANSGQFVFLLVYIHTAPDHYKRRMVIRQTWGDARQYPVDVRIVFFTGSPSTSGVQRALAFEAEQYGDIVQEDFLDSYKNLTYKGIAALKWISSFCNRAKFVLKTDDDIFVNMFTLIRHLKRLDSQHGGTVNHLLMCLVWNGMPVLRSGKWGVSKDEWKEDTYPTYCSGSAFVMSTDVATALHNVSYEVPFFWVDDLYITGLLPLKLGTIKHTQFMSTYLLNGKNLEEKFTGAQWYNYIFCHVSDLNAIQNVWKKVVAIEKGQFHPKIQYLILTTSSSSSSTSPPPH